MNSVAPDKSDNNTLGSRSISDDTGVGRRLHYLLVAASLCAFLILLKLSSAELSEFPISWNIGLEDRIDEVQGWVIGARNQHPLFTLVIDPIRNAIDSMLRSVESFLVGAPWPAVLIVVFVLADRSAGRKFAVFALVSMVFLGMMGLWVPTMQTAALVGVSVAIALIFGIPLGVLSARSDGLHRILRPILDAMQTMPAFVYLIPVVLIFGIARVPAVVATVIYALPPSIRLSDMGIRQVPVQSVEAADAFGSTPVQKLIKVQIPLAMPAILVGINQTIMMALGIVVIAALIGAPGLGLEVFQSLGRQQVGRGLEAGLAIVLIAVIFDRISYGFSLDSEQQLQRQSKADSGLFRPTVRRTLYWGVVGLAILGIYIVDAFVVDLTTFPPALHVSIAAPVDGFVDWMRDNLYQIGDLPIGTGPFSDFVTRYLLNPLRSLLQSWLPWPFIIAATAVLCYYASGWSLAIFGAGSLFFIGLMGLWSEAMDTLSQVIVAALFAIIVGIPIGIWAARSDRFAIVLRPILDLLQTIPAFVYLVPVIMLFNVGRVPGIIASVLYAIPPVIRLTNLGIRQVAPDAIEAADAFGSTSAQKLFKVQIPLARTSILLGVNQTLMMVLAMVIVAGLVGGGALGLEAVTGLAKSQVGRGIEAGLAIVILAIIIDRITQSWAHSGPPSG